MGGAGRSPRQKTEFAPALRAPPTSPYPGPNPDMAGFAPGRAVRALPRMTQ